MPQVFRIGRYWVYFQANEGNPLEPVHVHVAEGSPTANATKVWITRAGKCLLCNNNSRIPERTLKNILEIIEARSAEVIQKWHEFFGEDRYFCQASIMTYGSQAAQTRCFSIALIWKSTTTTTLAHEHTQAEGRML